MKKPLRSWINVLMVGISLAVVFHFVGLNDVVEPIPTMWEISSGPEHHDPIRDGDTVIPNERLTVVAKNSHGLVKHVQTIG